MEDFLRKHENVSVLHYCLLDSAIKTNALNVLQYVIVPWILFYFSCYLWEIRFRLRRDKNCPLPLPNGKMGIPIIGEMLQFFLIGTKHQRKRQKEYGNVFRTHMFGRPTVIAVGYKHVKRLLLGEGQIVETCWPSTTRDILGENGIVNGDKQTHTTIKRLALRALAPKYMAKYAPVVQDGIFQHVQHWKGKLPVLEACKQMVSKTMISVLLGIEPEDPDIQLYIQAAGDIVSSIFSLPINLPGFAYYKGLRARQFVFKRLEAKLRSKMEASDEELICDSSNEFESVLLNIIKLARSEETKVELINLQNLSLELIFAGTQSLQCVSSSIVVHLSQRPELVARLREEIQRHGLWQKPMHEVTFEEIQSLQLVDCVVKETMRVTPSIPGGVRVALKTFELGGFQVPKGWQVLYSIKLTHEETAGEVLQEGDKCRFDPDAYFNCLKCSGSQLPKKANSIDPKEDIASKNIGSPKPLDSFADTEPENGHVCSKTADDYSYIPFGKGSRMCAGKNYGLLFLRVLVFELARTTDVKLVGKLRFSAVPMTRPHKSVAVEFTKLKDNDNC